jgi:hypothetical protein
MGWKKESARHDLARQGIKTCLKQGGCDDPHETCDACGYKYNPTLEQAHKDQQWRYYNQALEHENSELEKIDKEIKDLEENVERWKDAKSNPDYEGDYEVDIYETQEYLQGRYEDRSYIRRRIDIYEEKLAELS